MRAIVYDDEKKEVALVDNWPCDFESGPPCDSRSQYQAVLKVAVVGICNTDLEICRGYVKGFRQVLGHEGVAVVEQVVRNTHPAQQNGLAVRRGRALWTKVT